MTANWVTCATCGRHKAPRGRSVALEMYGTLCEGQFAETYLGRPGCPGYNEEPRPDCRWPGEAICGPGCNKDREGDE